MRKPDNLRAWLLRAVPELAAQPDRLHIFVQKGRVERHRGNNLSYKQLYDLILIVEDWGLSSDRIMVPLLAWLDREQPDIFHGSDPGFAFEMDILDNKTADIECTLPLSEHAVVVEQPDGGWTVAWQDEPKLNNEFEGLDPAPRLWQLFGTRFAQSDTPDTDLIAAHPDHRP
jgi:P2 phage tail completion protein R (GpR)